MSSASVGKKSLKGASAGYGRRKAVNHIMTVLAYACTAVAILPLTWIIIYVIVKGLGAWNVEFFTGLPQSYGGGGGVTNGIIGTFVVVGLATLMGVPVGVMAGIYLSEYGDNRPGAVIRFLADTLTGVPSVVVGIFAYSVGLLVLGSEYSALAGGFALAVLMIPVITRTTEGIISLVPNAIREAALGLGVSRWKTILRVVLPTALSGIVTGVLLSIARVAGETAPLILTIFGTNFPVTANLTDQPYTTLSLQVYQLGGAPSPEVREVAWGAALLLMVIVLGISLFARLIFKGSGVAGRG
jgi:phosphate transport system permease protein